MMNKHVPLLLLSLLLLALSGGARASAQTGGTLLTNCGTVDAPGVYRLGGDLGSNGDCIKILANNVTLDCGGHTIRGNRFIGKGVKVESADGSRPTNIEIRGCRILGYLYGIEVQNGTGIRIRLNDLTGNFDDTHGSYHGIWLGLVDGGGVRVNGGTDILIEGNTANNGANGIDVRDSSKVRILSNITNKNSANGIVLTNSSDSVIESNTVNDNIRWCTFPSEKGDVVVPGCDSAGIMLQDGSSRNKVRYNTVLGQNGDGVFVRNHTGRCGDDTVIEKNKIAGAVWNSIEAGFCDRILISGNEFNKSRFGVWISYMDGVRILNNTFADMEQAGIVLKNSHHGQIKNNLISASAQGIAPIGSTDDEKFGWTMKHPFAYYRSYANVVTGNIFRDIKGETVRLEGSTGNVVR